jgi:hypothetical protein
MIIRLRSTNSSGLFPQYTCAVLVEMVRKAKTRGYCGANSTGYIYPCEDSQTT